MKFGALFSGGIGIYAVVALAWSAMMSYGFTTGLLPRALEIVVLLVSCLVAGGSLRLRGWKDILPYSIGWALIAVALDALFIAPSQDWQLYAQWWDWAWYALIVILPLLSPIFRRQPAPGGVWET